MRALALAAALAAGCQPTSQILLHVDTDAIVPPRSGTVAAPGTPPWLFDRLRVELFDGGAPAGARDFELDQGLLEDGAVSIGVAPPVGDQAVTARLRLFRGDHAIGGQPIPTATIDSTFALPALDSSEVVHLTARLRTADVGQKLGPLAPDDGEPGPTLAGTWPGATIVPCRGTAAADESCVPGGAYWMGDPIIKGDFAQGDSDQERLVVISPFYVDLHEVTVADFRSHYTMLGVNLHPIPWNESSDPTQFDTWCTYTAAAVPADPADQHAPLAANCMAYEKALAYCSALGRTLPSEAQLEFLASGRGAERAFPWGDDEPGCADAVWGLGGLGILLTYDSTCRTDALPVAIHAPGAGARDRIALPDPTSGQLREVLDLAGNLNEWVLDGFVPQTDPFWSAPGVRTDPVYSQTFQMGTALYRSARGGTWYEPPTHLRAGARSGQEDRDSSGNFYEYYATGWRCAHPG